MVNNGCTSYGKEGEQLQIGLIGTAGLGGGSKVLTLGGAKMSSR